MGKIILITGGERSGKSVYAEKLALTLSPHPVYMATARIWDEEFRRRVEHHRARRGPQWTNIEEEKCLSRHNVNGRVVLVDCVTLWSTNFFFDMQPDGPFTDKATDAHEAARQAEEHVTRTLQALQEEFDRFTRADATFIFVSNEIGWGGVPMDSIQRHFTDLLGWMNQYIARRADEVTLMVSGLPLSLKTTVPTTDGDVSQTFSAS